MAYCTADNVAGEFKGLTFSASTPITSTRIAEIIEEVDAEIDCRLGLKYEVPITGTQSLKLMRRIAVGIIADRIRPILTVKTGDERSSNKAQGEGKVDPIQMLTDIVDGKIRLTDATLRSSNEGIRSYNVTESIEPVFRSDEEQW